jgi:Putative metallopeptidase
MVRSRHTGAVLAAALLLAGCGNGGGPSPVAASSPSAAIAPSPGGPVTVPADANALTGAPEPTTAPDDGPSDGQMIVTYNDATTPEAIRGRDLMQKTHLLEGLAKDINDSLKLPYDIPLIGEQCGVANDFWSPEDKTMTLCYEDIDYSLNLFTDAKNPDPEAVARRVAIGAFYHELGHMVIDIYDLPVTGREEDVADQMAAFALLQRDGDGKFNPEFVESAKDTAEWYEISAKEQDPAAEGALADVHSLDQARMFNFDCWIYGSDPAGNADIVGDATLPEDRAGGCEDEYNQLVRAWNALLAPHWK